MGLKIVSLSKLAACCLALLLHAVLTPTAKSHIRGCNINIQEIDIGLCLNQSDGSFSIDHSCCKMLNQAVQIGYSCLCLLAAATIPPPIPPLLLPFSNCSISVPPLTFCQVVSPFPGGLTPSSPDELIQPPIPPVDVPLSPPPNKREVRDHLNITRDSSSSGIAETQPPSSGGVVPKLYQPNRHNDTSNGRTRGTTIKATLWRILSLCLILVVFSVR